MMTHGLAQIAADETPSFEKILDSLAHPVLLMERSGEIIYANQAGQNDLGSDLLGKQVSDLFGAFPETTPDLPFSATLSTDDQRSFEVLVTAAGGHHCTLSLHEAAPSQPMSTAQDVDELTGWQNGRH